MIFHENRLLADDSYEISYLIFSKIKKNVAKFFVCYTVVIGSLRVNGEIRTINLLIYACIARSQKLKKSKI